MRLSLLLGFLLAALSFAPAPAGAAITGGTTFDTVDAVETSGGSYSLRVTGLVSGEETPREVSFGFGGNVQAREECMRMFLLSLNKPGVYSVQINSAGLGATACRIQRRAP